MTSTAGGEPFASPRYLIRTKLLRLFGGAFHVFDATGRLALYTEMKRFRLREDLRLYPDEQCTPELLRIATQSIFDIAGAYDVHDSTTGEHIGTLRRAGLSSTFYRDRWTILSADGREIGFIEEDSVLKGLVRRYIEILALFLPQRYHAVVGARTVASFQQRFNPLILKLEVDFTEDADHALDRRLGLAAGVLLSAIEGRQQ
jgi:uncharacterized protein YxjI